MGLCQGRVRGAEPLRWQNYTAGEVKTGPLLLPGAGSKGEEKPRHRKLLEIALTPLATKPPGEAPAATTSPSRAAQHRGDAARRGEDPAEASERRDAHLRAGTQNLSPSPRGSQGHARGFGVTPAEEIPSPAPGLLLLKAPLSSRRPSRVPASAEEEEEEAASEARRVPSPGSHKHGLSRAGAERRALPRAQEPKTCFFF